MIKHYPTHIQKKFFSPLNTKGETPLIFFKLFFAKIAILDYIMIKHYKVYMQKKSYPYVLRVSYP